MFPTMPNLFFFNFLTLKCYFLKSLRLMIGLGFFIALSQNAAQAQNIAILNESQNS